VGTVSRCCIRARLALLFTGGPWCVRRQGHVGPCWSVMSVRNVGSGVSDFAVNPPRALRGYYGDKFSLIFVARQTGRRNNGPSRRMSDRHVGASVDTVLHWWSAVVRWRRRHGWPCSWHVFSVELAPSNASELHAPRTQPTAVYSLQFPTDNFYMAIQFNTCAISSAQSYIKEIIIARNCAAKPSATRLFVIGQGRRPLSR